LWYEPQTFDGKGNQMTVINKDFIVNNGLQITGYITSIGGSGPLNGQLLIGDTTNNRWSVGSITTSNGATVSQGAGTINISTNATNANTASTIVARDSSGNFIAGTISANISGGTISGSTGTFTSITANSGSSSTALSVTTSGAASSINVIDTGVNGANIHLTGNGSTTPTKSLRVNGGSFQVVNNAYTTTILSLDDSGDLSSLANITASGTVTAASFSGSATLSGTPTAPTAAAGTNTTQIATTAFVNSIFAAPPAIGVTTRNSANFTTLAANAGATISGGLTVTGGTSTDTLTITGTSTAPTATVNTNTTQLATTAFVKSMTGNMSGFTLINSNMTVTLAEAGNALQFTGATAVTATLPTSTFFAGAILYFYNNSSANQTVVSQNTDFIYDAPAISNQTTQSIVLAPGDTMILMSRGNTEWDIIGGSVSVWRSTAPAFQYPITVQGGVTATTGTFSGAVTATTAATGTTTSQLATTAFVSNTLAAPPAIGGTVPNTATFTNLVSTGHLVRSVSSAVAAAGTTQATATSLTTDINYVSSGTGGVILPAYTGGDCFIINNSGAAITIYPQSGGYLNFQAANAGISMANQSTLHFVSVGSSWFSVNATYA
jgi:hypothetical protein